MTPPLLSAVELRLCGICRCLGKNLIRQPKLSVLPPQHLEPLTLIAGQTCSTAFTPLSLSNSLPQRLRRTTDLARNRADRYPLRFILPLMLANKPNRPLPHFRCIPGSLTRDTILSDVDFSGKHGAVQNPVYLCNRVFCCIVFSPCINSDHLSDHLRHYPTPIVYKTCQNATEMRVFGGKIGPPGIQFWLLTTRSAVRVCPGELKQTHWKEPWPVQPTQDSFQCEPLSAIFVRNHQTSAIHLASTH
jgi:hypothetical protein